MGLPNHESLLLNDSEYEKRSFQWMSSIFSSRWAYDPSRLISQTSRDSFREQPIVSSHFSNFYGAYLFFYFRHQLMSPMVYLNDYTNKRLFFTVNEYKDDYVKGELFSKLTYES